MDVTISTSVSAGARRGFFSRGPRRLAGALLSLLCLLPSSAAAEQILTLRSAPLAVFDAALEGFKTEYRTYLPRQARKTVAPIRYTDLTVTELRDGVQAVLRQTRPDLVVAVGQRALESVADTKGIPILHLMATRVPERLAGRVDVYGVSMGVDPEQWVSAYARAMPGRLRVGVVYDPRRTGTWLERAILASGLYGVVVHAVAVDTPRAVRGALGQLEGRVDALWMLPDLTVIASETTELFAAFSLEQSIPVFSFAERYLTQGATAALVRSPFEIGRQGARWVAQMVGSGANSPGIRQVPAPRVVMRVNPSLALRFLPRPSASD